MPYFSRKRLRSRSRSIRRYKRRFGRNAKRFTRRSRINRQITYHKFRRTFALDTINDNSSIMPLGIFKAYSFKFQDNVNYSDFVNMYDAYKILKIIIRVEPCATGNDLLNISTISNKYIRVCHDYDDSVTPTSESQLMEYQNMKSYPACGKAFRIILYPKISGMVYRTISTTGYTQMRPVYCDMSQTDIEHYGVKMFFPPIGMNGKLAWQLYATMIFICKDSR